MWQAMFPQLPLGPRLGIHLLLLITHGGFSILCYYWSRVTPHTNWEPGFMAFVQWFKLLTALSPPLCPITAKYPKKVHGLTHNLPSCGWNLFLQVGVIAATKISSLLADLLEWNSKVTITGWLYGIHSVAPGWCIPLTWQGRKLWDRMYHITKCGAHCEVVTGAVAHLILGKWILYYNFWGQNTTVMSVCSTKNRIFEIFELIGKFKYICN